MAQTIELTNPEVAAKYTCTRTLNCIVHVPHVYRGLLSNVTPQAAAVMVGQGHTALVPKPETAAE